MPRRGPREGSISRRADGRWEARISLGHRGGKRIRRGVYGRTRREAQEKLANAMRVVEKVGTLPSERLTVEQFLRHWLADSVAASVRPATLRSYEMHVRLHLVPEIGGVPLARLTPLHVQAMLNRKVAGGLSARTVNHIRAVLRRALNQGLRWGLVTRNVAMLVDPPRVARFEVLAMSPADAIAFIQAVRGDRLEALYTAALATGLRQGELLGLRWDDVDLTEGRITVRQALQRVAGKLRVVEPKTSRSRRTIAIPSIAAAALRAHRARQIEDRLLAGSRWHETGFVFTTTVGTPLDGPNVTHRLQGLLRRSGLPAIRFHDLRHACASLLLVQGVHPRVVMETLGHSQISLTMNTYAHVLPSLQRDAADRIDSLLSPAAPLVDAPAS